MNNKLYSFQLIWLEAITTSSGSIGQCSPRIPTQPLWRTHLQRERT